MLYKNILYFIFYYTVYRVILCMNDYIEYVIQYDTFHVEVCLLYNGENILNPGSGTTTSNTSSHPVAVTHAMIDAAYKANDLEVPFDLQVPKEYDVCIRVYRTIHRGYTCI